MADLLLDEPRFRDDLYGATASADVTAELTIDPADVFAAYDPKELRDPHTGKWIKDPAGRYLDEALKEIQRGKMLSHNGHEVDRSAKGFNVRFYKREGGKKVKVGEGKTYEHATDAAEALRRGRHLNDGELKHGKSHLPGAEGKPKPPEPPKPGFKTGDRVSWNGTPGTVDDTRPDGSLHVQWDEGGSNWIDGKNADKAPPKKLEEKPVIPKITKSAPSTKAPREKWLQGQAAPAAQAAAAQIYGTKWNRWTGTTYLKEQKQWDGVMEWGGSMGLRPHVADSLAEALDPHPDTVVSSTYGLKVYLHEINHAVGSGQHFSPYQESQDYMTKAGHDYEEGFTELGAWLHMPAFLKHLGIENKRTKETTPVSPQWETEAARLRLDVAQTRQDLYDADTGFLRDKLARAQVALRAGNPTAIQMAEEAIHALDEAGYGKEAARLQVRLDRLKAVEQPKPLTLGEYFDKHLKPESFTASTVADAAPGLSYRAQVRQAYKFLDGVAEMEQRGPKMTRSPGTPASRFKRVQELSALVNARSGPAKRQAMIDMFLNAEGIKDISPAGRDILDKALVNNWTPGNDVVQSLDARLMSLKRMGEAS